MLTLPSGLLTFTASAAIKGFAYVHNKDTASNRLARTLLNLPTAGSATTLFKRPKRAAAIPSPRGRDVLCSGKLFFMGVIHRAAGWGLRSAALTQEPCLCWLF